MRALALNRDQAPVLPITASRARSVPLLHPLPHPGPRKPPSLHSSSLSVDPQSWRNIATCCFQFPHLRPSKSLFARPATLGALSPRLAKGHSRCPLAVGDISSRCGLRRGIDKRYRDINKPTHRFLTIRCVPTADTLLLKSSSSCPQAQHHASSYPSSVASLQPHASPSLSFPKLGLLSRLCVTARDCPRFLSPCTHVRTS
ncbi:hypothetical protein BV22DRAFT_917417 [Leucogyrophana mollusca]|uniref:Uncharacterized protein n=1 Tax=Leucogyrophana mollusca TaxID=85980 RepID=A0ACB8AXI6_9AGAM|nr:hypothetical protein BV22DRAFT_917417 [Leucogyrophana mollusca]